MAGGNKILKVMISSTIVDLPAHRREAIGACLRQGMFPLMMEHQPANDDEAVSSSVKMVNDADIYVGIYANRYGYVPKAGNPKQISVTEMEYNRAVERGIPRLIFITDSKSGVKTKTVDQEKDDSRLKTFVSRIQIENIVNFFKSPTDLRAHIINSLSFHRPTDPGTFQYISHIPISPEKYIAHPYTLLQTHQLVGRQKELNLLTDWVANTDSDIYQAHILSIVAIGGMGKSALTWKWFNEIAPEEMKPLAGRMWWSFYEPNATFENFVLRALAYVSNQPIEAVHTLPAPERELELLFLLERASYLIVLDGLERVLIEYAGANANYLNDNSVSDERNKRKTADPRIGNFFRKLAHTTKSRVLISTRLHPAELEGVGGDLLNNVFRYDLSGLDRADAIHLWGSFNISGSPGLLEPIFDSIDRHPLLIQALAGEIKGHRKAPGNLEEWLTDNQRFDPVSLRDVDEAMAHIMKYALKNLKENTRKVLNLIAAFRMPASYEALVEILVGSKKLFKSDKELDEVLTEVENRGLVGWDKRANHYDIHPIIRSVVWKSLDQITRTKTYESLQNFFGNFGPIELDDVTDLDDLTPNIEFYNTMVGMERYDHAFKIFEQALAKPLIYRLGYGVQVVNLLNMLFPDGLNHLPRLKEKNAQAITLIDLARGYQFSGRPGQAVPLYKRSSIVHSDKMGLAVSLCDLSYALRLVGNCRDSEHCAYRALMIARELEDPFQEAVSLQFLGLAIAFRGSLVESKSSFQRAINIFDNLDDWRNSGFASSCFAQREVLCGNFESAVELTDWALSVADDGNEILLIRATRLQAEVILELNHLDVAEEKLHEVLTRSRTINYVEEELPALTALAELRRRQGDGKAAREFLEDVWEFAERGPYPLLHADALNVLAQIERDAGNTEKAIEAATKAYQLAWCDGPPYAYHWGLVKAQKHLEELGAPLPEMPPFDESKYGPMPEVEIDPDDEFHVGDSS
jgi:tetratricopeptide (TPR) repeat protein